MLHWVYIGDPPTLLDDLLDDSARVYHHRCTIIQTIFHQQWLTTLGEEIGKNQIEFPDTPPAVVEKRVRRWLDNVRRSLQAKAREMIQVERADRDRRDEAIRTYVATLPAEATAQAA